MNKPISRWHRRILSGVTFTLLLITLTARGNDQVFLGPPDTGTWSGNSKWMNGMQGNATVSYDFNDTGASTCAFVISNTVAGKENTADWRCVPFALGPAANRGRPITFSFAYKLVDRVAPGNNIHVQLRFFDATGTNFIGEQVTAVGAQTRDSAMADYRTLTFNGIMAPPNARMADVWIDANIFEPWFSGTALFSDISVTTAPRSLQSLAIILGMSLVGLCVVIGLVIYLVRRRTPARR